MKTKTTFLLLSILLFAITACNNNETSVPQLKFGGMKGNVSMVKESEYDAIEKFGEIVPNVLRFITIYEFDKNGNEINTADYSDDGECLYKKETSYENGQLSSITYYDNFFMQSKITENRVIAREKNHIKWLCGVGTDEEYTIDVFYKGLYSKAQDKDGILAEECFYDKNGNRIEQKLYNIEGELVSRCLCEFDKDNNLIKRTYYSNEESNVTTHSYPEYDKKGNWITQYTWIDGKVTNVIKREITYR